MKVGLGARGGRVQLNGIGACDAHQAETRMWRLTPLLSKTRSNELRESARGTPAGSVIVTLPRPGLQNEKATDVGTEARSRRVPRDDIGWGLRRDSRTIHVGHTGRENHEGRESHWDRWGHCHISRGSLWRSARVRRIRKCRQLSRWLSR